jgi:hypothetical protein
VLLTVAKPAFTPEQCHRFEDAANPHSWFLSASLLHDQAVVLRSRFGQGLMTLHAPAAKTATWDVADKATFLLCAVALENAIKAFLVYENPQWVSDGYLHSEITNHRLSALADKSHLIPYKDRDRWVLRAFEDGNESWMRYPCGRRADDTVVEPNFDDRLWHGYLRVMRGYGTKLKKQLSKGWKGPHQFQGRWEARGDWLGSA